MLSCLGLDLLIESDSFVTRLQRSRIKLALEAVLAMPVDIIAIKRGEPAKAFQRIALATGVSLGGQ